MQQGALLTRPLCRLTAPVRGKRWKTNNSLISQAEGVSKSECKKSTKTAGDASAVERIQSVGLYDRLCSPGRVVLYNWLITEYSSLSQPLRALTCKADVIKLEVPGKGDDSRHMGPPFVKHLDGKKAWSSQKRESAHFLGTNRNKRSITINLKNAKGVEIAKDILKTCDILVENQLTDKMKALGLGYQAVKAIKPDIIYCSLTGFGATGPYRRTPGYDLIVAAESGIIYSTGEKEGPVCRPGPPLTDLMTGMSAVQAILAAVISRQQTGKGVYIDMSMFDVQASTLGNLAASWLNSGVEVERVGTGHVNIAPYQAFNTADGQIIITIANDAQFKRLAENCGHAEWAEGEYRTNGQRIADKHKLAKLIEAVLVQKPSEHWAETFFDKGFPFGLIRNMQQVFSHPQAEARGIVQEADHPLVGKARFVASAPVFNGERMQVTRPPPSLGEHTEEVLKEFGYNSEQVRKLQKDGVL